VPGCPPIKSTAGLSAAATTAGYAISGKVTGTGGVALSGIEVDAYDTVGNYSYNGVTVSDGTYSVGVPAGTYTIYFYVTATGSRYLPGYYGGSSVPVSWNSAADVAVTADVPGINVQLQTGYFISGRVTGTGSVSLADISVDIYTNDNSYQGWDSTANDGTYSVLVSAGNFNVHMSDYSGTYLNGYYNSGAAGHFSYSSGTLVGVTSSDVPSIDVTLGTGYHIKGKVTASDGTPIGDIQVGLDSSDYSYRGYGMTAADGTYSVAAPVGTFTVYFNGYGICGPDFCEIAYASGYYSTGGFVLDYSLASPVVVTGADVTGINVVMGPFGSTYHAIPPTRVLDTRNGTGGLSGPFTNHVARTFQVTGVSSGVPAGATAVTGNLTVTGQTSSGYLSIGPVAQDNPSSSTLNFPKGDDRANAVSVALSKLGTLSITFVAPSNGNGANAIFDVTGFYTADTSGSTYHALKPTRVLDSRGSTGGLPGPFTNHVARTFVVTGGSSGVPSTATAVTGNLTVTGQTSSGYLFIGPAATSNPGSSTLNFPVGDDRANAVTVAVGVGGTLSITFVAPSNGPTAQVIFDVTGYFTDDMTGATYVPLTPTRLLDTRNGTGGLSGPFGNHYARSFGVSGSAGVPSYAVAVTGNLTVTGQTSSGYLYIGPSEKNDPTSSTINFPAGDDRANAVAVALGTDGILAITFVAPSNGPTAQAILDVTGYFVPQAK